MNKYRTSRQKEIARITIQKRVQKSIEPVCPRRRTEQRKGFEGQCKMLDSIETPGLVLEGWYTAAATCLDCDWASSVTSQVTSR